MFFSFMLDALTISFERILRIKMARFRYETGIGELLSPVQCECVMSVLGKASLGEKQEEKMGLCGR